MAQSQGIDLATAVRSKFDRTSQKIGYVAEAEESRLDGIGSDLPTSDDHPAHATREFLAEIGGK